MILKSIEELIQNKTAMTADAGDTIRSACVKMAECDERALAVFSGEALVGIVSEKDIVQKAVAIGLDVNTTTLAEIMTKSPSTIDATDTVAHAIDIMTIGTFHHLPVLKDGKYSGMVYSDDIPEEYKLLLEHYKELKG